MYTQVVFYFRKEYLEVLQESLEKIYDIARVTFILTYIVA